MPESDESSYDKRGRQQWTTRPVSRSADRRRSKYPDSGRKETSGLESFDKLLPLIKRVPITEGAAQVHHLCETFRTTIGKIDGLS